MPLYIWIICKLLNFLKHILLLTFLFHLLDSFLRSCLVFYLKVIIQTFDWDCNKNLDIENYSSLDITPKRVLLYLSYNITFFSYLQKGVRIKNLWNVNMNSLRGIENDHNIKLNHDPTI